MCFHIIYRLMICVITKCFKCNCNKKTLISLAALEVVISKPTDKNYKSCRNTVALATVLTLGLVGKHVTAWKYAEPLQKGSALPPVSALTVSDRPCPLAPLKTALPGGCTSQRELGWRSPVPLTGLSGAGCRLADPEVQEVKGVCAGESDPPST